ATISLSLWELNNPGVVVLHYKPASAPLDDDKRTDVLLRTMLYSVGRCEGTQYTCHSSHCHILSRKSDIHIRDGIGCALQESLMHSAHCPQRCFAVPVATSVWIDVVPVFRRVVGWRNETIIECLIKCLDRSANSLFSVVAQDRRRHHQEQTKR